MAVAALAQRTILRVLAMGEECGKTGWKETSILKHIHRGDNHGNLFLLGDTSEDHLANRITRDAMALYIDRNLGSKIKPRKD